MGSRNRKLARRFILSASPVSVAFVAFDRDTLPKQVRLLASYLDFVSGNNEILVKQHTLFPSGTVLIISNLKLI